MSFDPKADPEGVAARAAELALEQLDRLDSHLKRHPGKGADFYMHPFEISISNNIARLMGGYATLKGYVPESRLPQPPEL